MGESGSPGNTGPSGDAGTPPPIGPASGSAKGPPHTRTAAAAGAGATPDPGEPVRARFDGIADGRVGDEPGLRGATAGDATYGGLAVDVDSGRFTVVFSESDCGPGAMTDANRAALIEALRRVAAAAEGPVESTLRCTEVFREAVRETVFTFDAGEVRALSRDRPLTPEDRAQLGAGAGGGAGASAAPPISGARLALIAAALLVAFGAVAWSTGWIDRLAGARAAELVVDTGPFGATLAGTLENDFGDYVVTLRRGPSYPVSSADATALGNAATSPAERVAITAVANGGTIWIRLERADGKGLAAAPAQLSALATAADRTIQVRLPARIGAARVELAVDAGADLERR